MRLLNTTTFELEYFSHDAMPLRYAILSHIWGKDEDEISFRDIQEGRIKTAENRPIKLEGCCTVAKGDGHKYIWIDTCCIDNTNSVELHEAINSMFRWYAEASICYAYLSDLPADDKNPWDANSKFSSSRWFQRGWTLQELIVPPRLRFYNSEWHFCGTKGDLCPIVEKASGIPSPYLLGIKPLRDASVAQRMSWAATRVTKKPDEDAFRLLLSNGADITVQANDGRHLTHLAAKYGFKFAMKSLLESEVDIEAKGIHSKTALHEAALYGKHETTNFLLEKGAAVDAVNNVARTPLQLAAAQGEEAILIKHGANLEKTDDEFSTPLHVASQAGHLPVLELLIKEGANIDAKTSSDETPLSIATQNAQVASVEELLRRRATIVSNKDGLSPLHWAASIVNEAILATLLKNSDYGHLNQLTNSKMSPLDYARINDHKVAAKRLEILGAQRGSNTIPDGSSATGEICNVLHSSDQALVNRSGLSSPFSEHRQSPSGPKHFDKFWKRRKPT